MQASSSLDTGTCSQSPSRPRLVAVAAEYQSNDIVKQDVMVGGRIEFWQRGDGVWGVSLLPNYGRRGYPGETHMPGSMAPPDFPAGREPDAEKVLAWARGLWHRERFGEPEDS
jgi:hypothetical protein